MRWVLVAALTAVLVACAWWLLGREESGAGSDDALALRDDAGGRDGPTLSGSASRGLAAGNAAEAGSGAIVGRVTRDGVPAEADVEARRVPLRRWGGRDRGYYQARLQTPEAAPPPVARTRSARDGTFSLAALPTGSFEVYARAADGSRAVRFVEIPAAGARTWADLALAQPGLTLRGLAITSTGSPVAGRVVAWPTLGDQQDWEVATGSAFSVAEVGADGTFELTGLVPGEHAVRLYLAGGGVAMPPKVMLPTDERYEIVVPHAKVTLRGRVLAEPGADPVERADVVVWANEDACTGPLLLRASTDIDGRFSFLVPDGMVYVLVETPGFPSRSQRVRRLTDELVIRLPRAGRVEGRVLALGDGSPAAGARVVAYAGSTEEVVAIADAEGRYVLPQVAQGTPEVLVVGGGWATPGLGARGFDAERASLDVPAGARLTHDLVAERMLRLEGRTLAADGTPVAGAVVNVQYLQRSLGDDDNVDLDPLPTQRVASDADGRFVFADLPAGTACALVAWAVGQPAVSSSPTKLLNPGPTEVELRFPAPSLVEVRVVGAEDGRPVPGAQVRLEQDVPQDADGRARMLTGSDGRARLGPVGPEALQVFVVAGATGATEHVPAGEGPGGRTRFVEVRLTRGLAIRGRVVLADGKAAAGASVRFSPVAEDGARDVQSRYDGSFLVQGLKPGRWVLHATRNGAGSEAQVAEAGAEGLLLKLAPEEAAPTRKVLVRVVDADGRPVPRFVLTVWADGSESTEAVEGGQTEITLPATPAAREGADPPALRVQNARGGDELPLALAPVLLKPIPADRDEIEVRLPAGRQIEGRVLLPDGSPATSVAVDAEVESTSPLSGHTARTRTDARGRFKLLGLTDAGYLLNATPPRGSIAPRATPARAGAADVLLQFRAAFSCRVRVLAWDGQPLPQARLSVQSEEQESQGDTADAEGRVELIDLDPAVEWRLLISPPEERDDLLPLDVPRWRPQDGDVRMERGRTIAGVVRDAAGTPVAGAGVWLPAEDVEGEVSTGVDGEFRLGPLKPGRHRVCARGPRRADEPPPTVEALVEAGRTDVVLTVDAGLCVRVLLPELEEPEAILRWRKPNGAWTAEQLTAASRGTYLLQGLDAKTEYLFRLAAAGGRCALTRIDPQVGEVRVTLEEGRSIRGRIVNAALDDRLWVWATHPSGVQEQVRADLEGRFQFQGLPSGRWTVSASDDRNGVRFDAGGDVEAGGTLDLLLAPRK